MRKGRKQGVVFVLVCSLLIGTVSMQAMASTTVDSIYAPDEIYQEKTEEEPDDELDDEEEIHEDVLDYSKTSEYWYNGIKVKPDKNGFAVCNGVLIGYEGTKTKITILSMPTLQKLLLRSGMGNS